MAGNVKEKVKQLSALICANCHINNYEKCTSNCKIHKLINEIIEMLG